MAAYNAALAKTEALEILRSLIDRVSVSAGEIGFTIELVGEIANMVRAGMPLK